MNLTRKERAAYEVAFHEARRAAGCDTSCNAYAIMHGVCKCAKKANAAILPPTK